MDFYALVNIIRMLMDGNPVSLTVLGNTSTKRAMCLYNVVGLAYYLREALFPHKDHHHPNWLPPCGVSK
jgi:hypothetical protein